MKYRTFKYFLILITLLTSSCSSKTILLTPTPTETIESLPTSTVSIPPPTITLESIETQEVKQCPQIGEPGNTWERYSSNTFANILAEANQKISSEESSNISFYIETSGEHQIPSCVSFEYSGEFREISEERKILIQAWSGIFGSEKGKQIREILKHEVLLKENGKEFWIPVQEPLIPYMQNELTEGGEVIVFIIWVGSSFLSDETDHVFVIGEFSGQ